MKINPLQLTSVLSLFLCLPLQATVRYVDLNCTNSTPPYLDWGTAATNIQDAVVVAEPADTILVTNGLYNTGSTVVYGAMANRVALTNAIRLLSVNGPQATIIAGGTQTRCVYVGTNAVLSGFTLTNGHALTTGDQFKERSGGGIWCETSGVVSNCLVISNTAPDTQVGSGGGVYGGTLYGCTLAGNSGFAGGGARAGTLWNCTLTGNLTLGYGSGGGAYGSTLFNSTLSGNSSGAYGSGGGAYQCLLSNCVISGNSATPRGGGASGNGGGTLGGTNYNCVICGNVSFAHGGGTGGSTNYNCVIVSNSAAYWGGGAYGGRFFNCTLVGNTATNAGGGFYSTQSTDAFFNSIVYFNSAPTGTNCSGTPQFFYTCITPFRSGPGNIAGDPMFVDKDHGLFQLQCGSPCIDAGLTNSLVFATATDIRGVPRPLDGNSDGVAQFDMGAFEFNPASDLVPVLFAAFTNVATQFPVAFSGKVGSCASYYWWDFGDGLALTNQLSPTHAWALPGLYNVRLAAFYPLLGQTSSATTQVQVVQTVYYVNASNPNPAPPYTNWATAARDIQSAISAATTPGRLVLVTNGQYRLSGGIVFGSVSNTVVLTNPVVVQSVNGPDATTIYAPRYPGRCAWVGIGAALSGFTLTDGMTSASGDVYKEQSGGAAWCEPSGLLTNCMLCNSRAYCYGGAVYQGTLYKCIVSNNFITNGNIPDSGGGGVFGATLYKCTVVNNRTAHANYGGGGGAAQCTLSNCAVTGNSAWVAGGGAHLSTLYNCIVSSNSVAVSGSLGGGVCSNTLYNCLLVGNSGYQGGGAFGGRLYNCTVACNTAVNGGGVYGAAVSNSVIFLNKPSNGGPPGYSNWYGGSFSYSCTAPLPAGAGNITNDPVFVDPAANFRLQTNSPCINSGMNGCVATTTDADGRPRIVNGTVDIGAYEFQGAGLGEFLGWLRRYGLATDGSADLADADGDHLNNWQEYCAGTDPANPASWLRVLTPSVDASGTTVRWQSVTNRLYCLERSTNLAAHPAFVTIATNIPGAFPTTAFLDTNATGPGPFFYRVGLQADLAPVLIPFSVLSFAWLQQYNLPTDGSADYADTDNDGMNNSQEWQSGTVPIDPSSYFHISSFSNLPPAKVYFQSATNRLYTLLSSTNLASWVPVTGQANVPGTGSLMNLSESSSGPQRFYRVLVSVP